MPGPLTTAALRLAASRLDHRRARRAVAALLAVILLVTLAPALLLAQGFFGIVAAAQLSADCAAGNPAEPIDAEAAAQTAALAAHAAGWTGAELVTAVAVAGAESGFDPNAINRNRNGSVDYGVWQINSIHAFDPSRIHDPYYNALTARRIYLDADSSWQPWTTYRNGRHVSWLATAAGAVADAGLTDAAQAPTAPSDLDPDGAAACQAPSPGGTAAGPWGGFTNGTIPTAQLCRALTGGPSQPGDSDASLLRCDAAGAFARMNASYAAKFGHGLPSVGGYRSLTGQIHTRNRNCAGPMSNGVWRDPPCSPATALPGRSNHGWALAVDLTIPACGTSNRCGFASGHYRWLALHAGAYGFVHPPWAQQHGSAPEYWHWEYVGGSAPGLP